ncbi:MAG: carboxylating nicotinate-nucleotide diphosphorylase [Candidatus Pacebacteria bacterium]|nr:carboxylating nicotinate-nucleotide diphosphorylase [Candidatus Paceibacterota bacterium]
MIAPLPDLLLRPLVTAALAEDLGLAGDITTELIAADRHATAAIVARQGGVCCGLDLARLSFASLDEAVEFRPSCHDGESVTAGMTLATVRGCARSLLSGERVALNYMTHLSGIATATAAMVAEIRRVKGGESVRLSCTRKTLPGLRMVQKYAVRCGGGSNHRFGLFDAILLKDNHLALMGSPAAAVAMARQRVGHLVGIEIEVDRLDQLDELLSAAVKPDVVLLDNMSPDQLRLAVGMRLAKGCLSVLFEASGGVQLSTVAELAATGVEIISAGWLTHSSRGLDIGLDFRAD